MTNTNDMREAFDLWSGQHGEEPIFPLQVWEAACQWQSQQAQGQELRYCEHCSEMVPLKCADPSGNMEIGFCGTAPAAVPEDVLHLTRFLANTWYAIDRFVYDHCSGESLMQYPVIQGTRNQFNLQAIGEQPFDKAKISSGVNFMLYTPPTQTERSE